MFSNGGWVEISDTMAREADFAEERPEGSEGTGHV